MKFEDTEMASLDLFDVGLGSQNTDGVDNLGLLDLQSQDSAQMDTTNLADVYGTNGLDSFDLQFELQQQEIAKKNRDYAKASPTTVNPTEGLEAKSVPVDLGLDSTVPITEEDKVKASIANNAMGAEVDAILAQAGLEENKRVEVVEALKAVGYSSTDSNSVYNKIPEELKKDITELAALKRAQNRFLGPQPNATAHLSRNFISALFGDPTAPKIAVVQERIKNGIQNFKGVDSIRTALIKATAQENPVFAESRSLALEEKAAKTVRDGTKVLLDNQHTVAARNALVTDYRARNPEARSQPDSIVYETALADRLAQERKDKLFEQNIATQRVNISKAQIAEAQKDRAFRASEAVKDRTFKSSESTKDRTFKSSEATKRSNEANTRLDKTLKVERAKIAKALKAPSVAEDRAIKKKTEKFMADLHIRAAEIAKVNEHSKVKVELPKQLQCLLDGTCSLASDSDGAVATAEPVLTILATAEASDAGFDSANHPKLKGLNLSKMTIGAVKSRASKLDLEGGKYTTAVGAFQFLLDSLTRAAKGAKLTDKDDFSPENQKKMATWLLVHDTTYPAFIASAKSHEDIQDFQMSVAKVWAGVPVPYDTMRGKVKILAGESYYKGIGSNRAAITSDDFEKYARSASKNPVTLDIAQGLLAGTVTERDIASREEDPRRTVAKKKAKEEENLQAVNDVFGKVGETNVLPEGVKVTEDGKFEGGILNAIDALAEADSRGSLNTNTSNMARNYKGILDDIKAEGRVRSKKIKYKGANVDYYGTMAAPVKSTEPLTRNFYNPVGLVTGFDKMDERVNALTVDPSINTLLDIAYTNFEKTSKNPIKDAAKEVRDYLIAVGRLKEESPVSTFLRIDRRPALKVQMSTGKYTDWLIKSSQLKDVDINKVESVELFEYLLRTRNGLKKLAPRGLFFAPRGILR